MKIFRSIFSNFLLYIYIYIYNIIEFQFMNFFLIKIYDVYFIMITLYYWVKIPISFLCEWIQTLDIQRIEILLNKLTETH